MTLFYAVMLLVLFYVLLIGEFLLPTGGLMGFAAAAALISTLVIAFSHSLAAGVVFLVVIVVSTPLLISGLLRAWPHTPIGRRMLNRRLGQVAAAGPPRTTINGTRLDGLVGHCGVALTPLLPSGLILVDGEKIDALSIGMPIEAGDAVKVTRVSAGRVQVRHLTEEDNTGSDGDAVPVSPPSLEQSLESLDFE
ncbi:hypothetical protein Poly51_56360 [Rubripirellula tenax]|uniref:NfeD-like C-terminal domain-containing protein n=1 Tax=Rubripirellula tenax TaxID=2528015 RepID=A0A5C6EBY7_9BACT|nr:NfeD family protein [Rubripirellula tenax]TWU46240.1 hypothetical protein Poly51_56360 [Rubripirellula tenax]